MNYFLFVFSLPKRGHTFRIYGAKTARIMSALSMGLSCLFWVLLALCGFIIASLTINEILILISR